MTKKIIFSSGGTGGHMYPAIHLMKYFSNKGYETLLVTDERCRHYLKKNPELNSYIIRTDTPTNKNFIKKILSFVVIFFAIIKTNLLYLCTVNARINPPGVNLLNCLGEGGLIQEGGG